MRHLSAVEVSTLVLAGVFVATGASLAIHPIATYLTNAGTSRFDERLNVHGIYVSKEEARVLGILSAACGAGLAWLALRRYNPPDDGDDSQSIPDDLTVGPVVRTPMVPKSPRDFSPRIQDRIRSAPELWRNN